MRLPDTGIVGPPWPGAPDARLPPLQFGCLARLGPYEIAGVLGSGAMGLVLRAYEPSLDRTVAIKLIKPEWADSAHARVLLSVL